MTGGPKKKAGGKSILFLRDGSVVWFAQEDDGPCSPLERALLAASRLATCARQTSETSDASGT
jgi:hypothetical protein